jgi:hypothetical protein
MEKFILDLDWIFGLTLLAWLDWLDIDFYDWKFGLIRVALNFALSI